MRYLLACLAAVLAASCQVRGDDPAPAPYEAGREVGRLTHPAATEASGLAASRRNPGVIWWHNDSGDQPRVFAMDATGRDLGEYRVLGAVAIDWEDMAVGPGPDPTQSCLYLGDVGDNPNRRPLVQVYRVPEPAVTLDQRAEPRDLPGAEKLVLKYPDGSHNCESLVVDPRTGDLYLISKRIVDGRAPVYRAAAAALRPGDPIALERVAAIVPFRDPAAIGPTAADISPDGTLLVVKNYEETYLWTRTTEQTWAQVLTAQPQAPLAIPHGPGEAIAFAADGSGYYTTREGADPPLLFFKRR